MPYGPYGTVAQGMVIRLWNVIYMNKTMLLPDVEPFDSTRDFDGKNFIFSSSVAVVA